MPEYVKLPVLMAKAKTVALCHRIVKTSPGS